ncbi:hypothetical protein ACFZDG_18345 [Kitasatospora xanthocidica]|uniref:hypothetical protein n=1 Tax=Kitasatospora xanthocidica TaxID=83382 RepID=UPI0036E07BB5
MTDQPVTRTDALANAVTWADRAEAAETLRAKHTRQAAAAAQSEYLRRDAHRHQNDAAAAGIDRQTAIDMAAMWTAIAAATPEEPQP